MATSNPNGDVDAIYKALRLLPEFDGNPHILTRFINLCDQLVLAHFNVNPGHELANLSLINGILNKVTGPAARLINSSGLSNTWSGIRSSLINNFADHRDETALYNDLSLQSQGSSSPQEFYERCQNLFSTIMTYVSLHETVSTTIEAKRTLYGKLTLQSYLRGLKDPLGSRVRCMRPATMEQALEFVQEELNTLYMQQRNEGPNRKEWQPHPFNSNFNLPLNNFAQKLPMFGVTGPSKQPIFNAAGPSRQPPMQSHPHPGWRPNIQPQLQLPQGPSRTQMMFRAPPPNYNPQNNLFRMPPRPQPQQQHSNFNFPRPMSGVSHYTPKVLPPTGRQDLRNFVNPPPSNYFKTREMNFNEMFDYGYDAQYDYDYSYPDYIQDSEYYYDYYDYGQSPYVIENQVVEDAAPAPAPGKDENFQEPSNPKKPK